jgi:hypothetical protein
VVTPSAEIEVQSSSVVSAVLCRDYDLDVTVFGFDAEEGLTV